MQDSSVLDYRARKRFKLMGDRLKNKMAVVTSSEYRIGRAIAVALAKEAQKLVQTTVDGFGRLDILVNNAGADAPHMVWNMTEEEWDRSVDSYVKGSFNGIRHACVVMRV